MLFFFRACSAFMVVLINTFRLTRAAGRQMLFFFRACSAFIAAKGFVEHGPTAIYCSTTHKATKKALGAKVRRVSLPPHAFGLLVQHCSRKPWQWVTHQPATYHGGALRHIFAKEFCEMVSLEGKKSEPPLLQGKKGRCFQNKGRE